MPQRPPSAGSALRKATAKVAATNALAGCPAPPKAKSNPENVKVCVRCRPLNRTERTLNEEFILKFNPATQQLCITNPQPLPSEDPEHVFGFDHVYDPDSASQKVFEDMGLPLVENIFDGFNASIFAYGQTGSGKTHSMMGTPDDPGVIPRVCGAIFERAEAAAGMKVTIRASYLQIYREVLEDLLSPGPELKIRRDPKLGTQVQGLSEHVLSDGAGLAALIEAGQKRRAVAATAMNAESSRSHAVVIIRVDQVSDPAAGACASTRVVLPLGASRVEMLLRSALQSARLCAPVPG